MIFRRSLESFNEKYKTNFEYLREIRNFHMNSEDPNLKADFEKLNNLFNNGQTRLILSVLLGAIIIIVTGILSSFIK